MSYAGQTKLYVFVYMYIYLSIFWHLKLTLLQTKITFRFVHCLECKNSFLLAHLYILYEYSYFSALMGCRLISAILRTLYTPRKHFFLGFEKNHIYKDECYKLYKHIFNLQLYIAGHFGSLMIFFNIVI
jgi:hypothetical protein